MDMQKRQIVAHTASQVDGTIIYNFPPTRFVKINTFEQQLDHIFSEVNEIKQLGPLLESLVGSTEEYAKVLRLRHLEIVDLFHSLETEFRIMADQHGSDYVNQLFAETQRKNAAPDRQYYQEG